VAAGLKDGCVHVRELGDFAVTYRVAGLLEDVQSLISARSNLRKAVLDALHAADIEVVSPAFMNTRAIGEDRRFIPQPAGRQRAVREPETRAEEVAFDVAEKAASVEELRKAVKAIEAELEAVPRSVSADREALVSGLEARRVRLAAELAEAEAQQARGEDKA
jgi:hypothetical protein